MLDDLVANLHIELDFAGSARLTLVAVRLIGVPARIVASLNEDGDLALWQSPGTAARWGNRNRPSRRDAAVGVLVQVAPDRGDWPWAVGRLGLDALRATNLDLHPAADVDRDMVIVRRRPVEQEIARLWRRNRDAVPNESPGVPLTVVLVPVRILAVCFLVAKSRERRAVDGVVRVCAPKRVRDRARWAAIATLVAGVLVVPLLLAIGSLLDGQCPLCDRDDRVARRIVHSRDTAECC